MPKTLILLLSVGIVLAGTFHSTAAQTAIDPVGPIISSENVEQLQEMGIVGRGALESAAFSPDGNTLALGTSAGVWFYNFANLAAPPSYLNPGAGYVTRLKFDVTGRYLQVMSTSPDVGSDVFSLWDLSDGFSNARQIEHGDLIGDGRFLLQANGMLWDTVTEADIQLDIQGDRFSPNFSSLVVSADDGLIAVIVSYADCCTPSEEIQLFHLDTGAFITSIRLEAEPQRDTGFSTIAFTEAEFFAFVWQRSTLKSAVHVWPTEALSSPNDEPMGLEAAEIVWEHPNAVEPRLRVAQNNLLVTYRLWDFPEFSADVIHMPDRTTQPGIAAPDPFHQYVLLQPVSGDVITLTSDQTDQWRVSDASTGKALGTLDNFGGSIHGYQFNADESQLMTVHQRVNSNWIDTIVRLRNTEDWEPAQTLTFNNQIETLVRFQPDSRALVAAVSGYEEGSPQTIELWDLAAQELLYTFPFDTEPTVSISPNGRFLFISTAAQSWLYDIGQPASPQLLPLSANAPLASIGFFSPSSRYLFLVEGSDSQILHLWDLETQTEVRTIADRPIDLNYFAEKVQWIDDEQRFVLCETGQVSFWSMTQLATASSTPLTTTGENILCRMDDDGRGHVVMPTYGSGIQYFALETPQNATSLDTAEPGWWRSAAFTPDGSVVFGGLYGNSLVAWKVADGTQYAPFNVGTWQIESIRYIRNGSMMVIETDDGTLRLWGVPG